MKSYSPAKKMMFDPVSGQKFSDSISEAVFRRFHYREGGIKWKFNPWTGNRREQKDIDIDPEGLLIRAPGRNDNG